MFFTTYWALVGVQENCRSVSKKGDCLKQMLLIVLEFLILD